MHLRHFRPGERQVIVISLFMVTAIFLGIGWLHSHKQSQSFHRVISGQLRLISSDLQQHVTNDRYPDIEKARHILTSPETAEHLHATSLFGDGDLYYNPTQPFFSDSPTGIILCARVEGEFYALQLDGVMRPITENELKLAGLVPLATQ